MADKKISQDYTDNPFTTWDGTEIIPGVKSGANGAGLASTLAAYIATVNGSGGVNRGVILDALNVPTLL